MSKPWVPKDPELLQSWLDAILTEASDELTDWEQGFIESVELALMYKKQLSEKQENILERIYSEKTS